MRKLLVVTVLFALFSKGISQNFNCGHDAMVNLQKAANPNYEQDLLLQNQRIKKFITDNYSPQAVGNLAGKPTPTVYTIPVVFHVIHAAGQAYGTGANLSYLQLQSQIDALNAAFGKDYPAYNGQSHPAYAQNTNIRFCLARLPEPANLSFYTGPGGIEYGVMRYANSTVTNHQMGNAGQTALLGLTHPNNTYFPFTDYLNIWVVTGIANGSAGITMGYAVLPGATSFDGIVMRSDVVGDNSVSGNNFSLGYGLTQGKILCHEAGHYLGLQHIFQGGCAGANAAGAASDACDLNGDYICDIEPCTTQNIACNQGIPNTCTANYVTGTTASDMIESYMSYADDDCMNTFTNNQAQRMWAALNTDRANLWQLTNLGITGVTGPNGCNAASLFINISSTANYCVGSLISLANPISGNTATSWTWTSAGSSMPLVNTYSIGITYALPGLHTVKLAASDGTTTIVDSIVVSVTNCSLDPKKLYRSNWMHGSYCSINFATGQPVVTNVAMVNNTIKCFENAVSMCDSLGNLLFYSNGRDLWNAAHQLVNPGAPLFGWDLNIPSPNGFNGTSVGGFMSFPAPKKPGKYFIVCVPPYETKGQPTVGQYAKINFVIYDAVSNTVTPFQSLTNPAINYVTNFANYNNFPGLSENLNVVPHCNGVDYWIVARGVNAQGSGFNFYSFLVNANGLNATAAPVLSGPFPSTHFVSTSDLKSNSSGNKMVCKARNKNIAYSWDFDQATGLLSNPVLLPTSAVGSQSNSCSGIIFSPNDQYIYSTVPSGIDMINVATNTIVKTIVPVNGYVMGSTYMEVGPDNIIYMNGVSNGNGPSLAQITNPDSAPNSTVSTYVNFTSVPGADPNISLLNFPEALQPAPSNPLMTQNISCSAHAFSLSPCWKIYNPTWNFGDGSAVSTASNVTHTYVNPGIYTVSLTLSYNGQPLPPFTRTVSVIAPGAVSITGPTVICIGSTYLNSYGATQIAGATYSWTATNASIAGPANVDNVSAAASSAGLATLSVQVTNGGCSVSATKTVNVVNLQVSLNLSATSSVVCVNQNVVFTGSPAGGTYSGTTNGNVFNSALTGTYNISYSYNANGCYKTVGVALRVTTCTGLNELNGAGWDVSLYPNPNSGMLYINSSVAIHSYEIVNTLGQIIMEDAYRIGISTEALSNGIYFISLKTGNGEKVKLKFIKE